MALNDYYSWYLQQNANDLSEKDNSPWWALGGLLLNYGIQEFAPKILNRIYNNRLKPENIERTTSNILNSNKYKNLLQQVSNLANFEYTRDPQFLGKSYQKLQSKLWDKYQKGDISLEEYSDGITSFLSLAQRDILSGFNKIIEPYLGRSNSETLINSVLHGLEPYSNSSTLLLELTGLITNQNPIIGKDYADTFRENTLSMINLTLQSVLSLNGNPTINQSLGSVNTPSTPTVTPSTPTVKTPTTPTVTNTTVKPILASLSEMLGLNIKAPTITGPIESPINNGKPITTSSTPSTPKIDWKAVGLNAASTGASAVGGYLGSTAAGKAFDVVGLNKTQTGRFISGLGSNAAGQVTGTMAANLVSGNSIGSGIGNSFTSGAGIAQGAMAAANIALDTFDPVVKSKGENIANMVGAGLGLAAGLAAIPVAGWIGAGALLATNIVGHAFGSKTRSFTADTDLLASTGNSYTGSTAKIMEALAKANTKYSAFNSGAKKKVDREIGEAMILQNTIDNIMDYNTKRQLIATSTSGINHINRAFNLQGGYQLLGIYAGKNGLKFNLDYVHKILSLPIEKDLTGISLESVLPEFKDGGTILSTITEIFTIPTEFLDDELKEIDIESVLPEFKDGGTFNVIPEGALHARRHNMDMEGITKKGIPVVSESDNGEIEQQAEVERQEIIFRLEITKKLEELAKDGSDEAALEAGKLLVLEILYNTIDNTNSLL